MKKREKRLAAVQARLAQVAVGRDLAPVLEPGALIEERRLLEAVGADGGDLQVLHTLGWLHWFRHQALPEGEDREDLDAAIRMFMPCFAAGVSGMPDPLLPILAVQATPTEHPNQEVQLADQVPALLARFEHTGALADLDRVIEASQAAVDAIPVGLSGNHAEGAEGRRLRPVRHAVTRALNLARLSATLDLRFERTGNPADLDAAIAALEAAIAIIPSDDPVRAVMLSNLGYCRGLQFQRTRALADLDAAIEADQAALNAAPTDHPLRAGMLANLGVSLGSRFQRTRALADLDAAIEADQAALKAAPTEDPMRPGMLSNLGAVLGERFRCTGAQADLDAAIRASRAAVDAAPAGDPDRAGMLSNLGSVLRERFERTGAQADLDAAIDFSRAAVDAAPPPTSAG